MEGYQIKLDKIYQKLGLFVSRYNNLKSDYNDLKGQNERLKVEVNELKVSRQNLTENLKVVQLAKTVEGEDVGQKDELKKKLNQYIKEIDRCVAMLND